MKAIVSAVLMHESMMKATSPFVDNIHANKDIMSADEVRTRLESFGLISKDPKHLKNGALVLGLEA